MCSVCMSLRNILLVNGWFVCYLWGLFCGCLQPSLASHTLQFPREIEGCGLQERLKGVACMTTCSLQLTVVNFYCAVHTDHSKIRMHIKGLMRNTLAHMHWHVVCCTKVYNNQKAHVLHTLRLFT